jgi:hypothetical protein
VALGNNKKLHFCFLTELYQMEVLFSAFTAEISDENGSRYSSSKRGRIQHH